MMLAMSPRRTKRGKFETFDEDENEALRQALSEYVAKNDLSTTDLKPLLYVSQQTAAGYLNGSGGFSRPAARQLAYLLGYDGVDDFLKAHGVFRSNPRDKNANGNRNDEPERAMAMSIGRRLGISELAMSRVNKRFGSDHHVSRWWVDRYIQEQAAVDEERLRRLEDARQPPRDED